MEATTRSNSRTVRIAVGLFFFVCVPLSLWESGVQSKIFVLQDPVATSNNLLSNEFSFRTSIVSHLMGTIVFTVMVVMFYKLLKPVDKHLSRFLVIPILAQIAIVFVLEAINFSALMTLKAEPRSSLGILNQQEAAYFLLRIYRLAFGANKIIFGLCFIPMGLLVFRSGFAPRVIGILIIMGGAGYITDSCLYILLQRADYLIVRSLKLYSSACYSLGFLWFLIKGIRDPGALTTQN